MYLVKGSAKYDPFPVFCTVYKLRIAFAFLNSWGENAKESFVACEISINSNFSLRKYKVLLVQSHSYSFTYC